MNTVIPNVAELKTELTTVLNRINRLSPKDSHLEGVRQHFHLGTVGGSGRNTYRLNKRREADLERTINNSKELCKLYERRNQLELLIPKIESGEYQKELEAKQVRKQTVNEKLAAYWNNLKVGDYIQPGNDKLYITKKNAKTILTGPECKWTAAEIIGSEAAKLL